MHKREEKSLHDNDSELYNDFLEIYLNEYMALSNAKKRKLGSKYDATNLFL